MIYKIILPNGYVIETISIQQQENNFSAVDLTLTPASAILVCGLFVLVAVRKLKNRVKS